MRIEQVDLGVGDRLADGCALTGLAQHKRRVRRRFRGTVEIVHAAHVRACVKRIHEVGTQRLAGQVHRPHRFGQALRLKQRPHDRGHRVDERHLVPVRAGREIERIVDEDDLASPRKRAEELEHGQVETD